MKYPMAVALTALAASAALVTTNPANADDVTVVNTDEGGGGSAGPNAGMLHSGIVTLGVSYVPAFVVAVESDVEADKNLYIPVAGPWIDYAERDCENCNNETLNKVLLVTDGIFQGIGALEIAGSFLFWGSGDDVASNDATHKTDTASVRLAPARLGSGGYGLRAVGQF